MAMHGGGLISGFLAIGFKLLFSVWGALPVFIFALIALLMVGLRITPEMLFNKVKNRQKLSYDSEDEDAEPPLFTVPDNSAHKLSREKKRRAPEPEEEVVPVNFTAKAREERASRRAIDIPIDDEEDLGLDYEERRVGFFNANPRVATPGQVLNESAGLRRKTPAVSYPAPVEDKSENPTENVKPLSYEEAASIAGVEPVTIKSEEVSSERVKIIQPAPSPRISKKAAAEAEIQQESSEVAKAVEEKDAENHGEYRYPPITLLKSRSGAAADGREEMALNRERLQATLNSFGVNASITDITRGPTVTRYDIELESGVRLSKITNLAGDLALALGVSGVRIAPIPDMVATVGIEVPNKIVSTVYLRSIIESPAFRDAASKLTFAIGEDIGGESICGNIAKLPHLLIAGTTGSGKSVCMNSLILSILYKASPEEVRFIMVDPKMVELGIYNGIPHLYIPVVTDPKKAAGALQWAVVEMLKRYRLFSEAGVRDLAGYNALRKRNGESILPQVVIVIDELADLMMVASREVEESICRVAQMGRASGMHLVIATQRPSADVITGLMKANIPSRISFAVSSAMESRIIMDQSGAEKLVGSGDMLYAALGMGKARRVQGAFVSDEEREEIVNFVKRYSEADYDDDIIAAVEKAAEAKSGGEGGKGSEAEHEEKTQYDELVPQAADVIFETKQASVSMLQRRLKLGYSRAARIVDQLEELGVLGPYEGSKPRQILVSKEQWQEMQLMHGTAPLDKAPKQMDMFADDEFEEGWDE
ncbi:MAG: DNA translocase FtsK [Ruminococcaceae bacterium]|nr:DNA translocase FtsK [Oscillospiraceae bacterium]